MAEIVRTSGNSTSMVRCSLAQAVTSDQWENGEWRPAPGEQKGKPRGLAHRSD